jgi:vancomycin permeability regulator SanA
MSEAPMSDDEVARTVFVREVPIPANLAMVFADANELGMVRRTKRGVELYRQGHVPRLLVTGGGVLARKDPEAKRMAQIAREMGVLAEDLLVEDQSANTFDNVRFSLRLLKDGKLLNELGTIILVSSEWHMRRVLLTMKKYFPVTIGLVCCPTLEGFNRENWTDSEEGRRTVMNEAELLAAFQMTGAL